MLPSGTAATERSKIGLRRCVGNTRPDTMNPLVHGFHHAATGSWTYVVADPGSHSAAIIDPVLDFDAASGKLWPEAARRIASCLREHELKVKWILETHAHADHLSAAQWLKHVVGGQVGIGKDIIEVQKRFARLLGFDDTFGTDGNPFDHLFADGESMSIGDLDLRVMATPGHTPDGVSYLIGDAIFIGDTLFAPSAGSARCDFPGADAATLYRSIQRLYAQPDATRVFLCHNYPPDGAEAICETSIAEQKAHNVHIDAHTSEADFVARRRARDATLSVPRLLWPALQVNIRAGALPSSDDAGNRYLRIPLDTAALT